MSDKPVLTPAQQYLQEVAPTGGALNAEQFQKYKLLLAAEGSTVSHEDELRELQSAMALLGLPRREGP